MKRLAVGLRRISDALLLLFVLSLLACLLMLPAIGAAAEKSRVEINPATQVVTVQGQEMVLVPKSAWKQFKEHNSQLETKLVQQQKLQEAQRLTSTQQAERLVKAEQENQLAKEAMQKVQSSQQTALKLLDKTNQQLDILSKQMKHDRLMSKKHTMQAFVWGGGIGLIAGVVLHARMA